MINEQGGVNGRKINLISLDDGYSPPKTVEQMRRLVEQEQVAFLFQPARHAAAVWRSAQYLNDNKVPQLFVATGASVFDDPEHFPGRSASTRTTRPRRASSPSTFWQDQAGRQDRRPLSERRLRQGLSDRLKAGSGADHAGDDRQGSLLRSHRSRPSIRRWSRCKAPAPTFSDRGDAEIRRAGDPQILRSRLEARRAFSPTFRLSVASVLKPAGIEKSKGLVTMQWGKDPTDVRWKDDPGIKQWDGVRRQIYDFTPYSSTRTPNMDTAMQCCSRISSSSVGTTYRAAIS